MQHKISIRMIEVKTKLINWEHLKKVSSKIGDQRELNLGDTYLGNTLWTVSYHSFVPGIQISLCTIENW